MYQGTGEVKRRNPARHQGSKRIHENRIPEPTASPSRSADKPRAGSLQHSSLPRARIRPLLHGVPDGQRAAGDPGSAERITLQRPRAR